MHRNSAYIAIFNNLSMNERCLFVLFVKLKSFKHGAHYHVVGIVGKLLMSRDASRRFCKRLDFKPWAWELLNIEQFCH